MSSGNVVILNGSISRTLLYIPFMSNLNIMIISVLTGRLVQCPMSQ